MAFMSNPATSGRSASHPIAAYFVLAFLLGIGPVLGTLGDDTRLPSFEETLGPRSVKSFTGAGNFLVLMCDKAFPSSAADSGLRAPAVPMLEPGRVEACIESVEQRYDITAPAMPTTTSVFSREASPGATHPH